MQDGCGKIPGVDPGVEIRHTTCDICSPQHHCGVNAYVKDGRLIKTEGWREPLIRMVLCPRRQVRIRMVSMRSLSLPPFTITLRIRTRR